MQGLEQGTSYMLGLYASLSSTVGICDNKTRAPMALNWSSKNLKSRLDISEALLSAVMPWLLSSHLLQAANSGADGPHAAFDEYHFMNRHL
jgi:hypothetical protein